jgi:hypothetical protein
MIPERMLSATFEDATEKPSDGDAPIALDQRAHVLVEQLKIFHTLASAEKEHAFRVFSWELGLKYASIMFLLSEKVKLTTGAFWAILVSMALTSAICWVSFQHARRGYHGNRRAISKCEAALGLYQESKYVNTGALFKYTPSLARSQSLESLQWIHLIASVIALFLVMLNGAAHLR